MSVNNVGEVMRRIKLFTMIKERFTRRMCLSRWSARRRVSWPLSVATESLESRCLLSAGDLDPSFGTGGKVTTSDFPAASVAIQTDGKLVVAGSRGIDFRLTRFNADGSLDPTFGVDGNVTTVMGSTGGVAHSVAIQGDGRIIVAGGNSDFGLARYNVDGSLDTSFGSFGRVITDFGSMDDLAFSVTVQSDGKIIAVGRSGNGFGVARYNHDGSLDSSFHGNGMLTTILNSPSDFATSVAIQGDGKIVVAGTPQGEGGYQFAVVRYNVDGGIDTSFGSNGNGKVMTAVYVGNGNFANSVAIQGDGKIIVAGEAYNGSNDDFAVARFNSDGSLDTSFDGDGKLTTDFGGSEDRGTSLGIQSNGKIVVAGWSDAHGFAVVRYRTDGSLDTSFGNGGKQTTDLGDSDRAAGMAIQTDGKIVVVGGFVFNGGNQVGKLVRYLGSNNEPPSFTSANTASIPENTTSALSVTASDFEHDSRSYSLSGGADQALFNIDSASGLLSFKTAPDFENPTDSDHNSVYSVQVQVSDDTNSVTQDIQVSVVNVEEPPTITSASTVSIPENTLFVFNVTGSDPEGHLPLYGIVGGADQSKFTLNFLTGVLSFVSPPDFEHPTDTNHDNVYVVQVAVSDGTHLVTQDISVTVTNVNETVTIPLPANGGNFKTLFLNGQLHLRSSLGKQLIAPVTLPSGAEVQFNGSNAADRLTLDRSWSRFTGNLTFNSNGGNDQFDARAVSLDVRFNGGDGNDTFLGGSGNDSVDGGAGNDSLTGGNGNDSILGGADNDRIIGDAGNDLLVGGTGDDSLRGGNGNDTLLGDAGRDTLNGESGNDLIDGGDDNDNLQGSDGNDSLRGGNGNDAIQGGNGSDILIGAAGNDSLKGDAGVDTLLGGSGNDTMDGGTSKDLINPGSGTDKITDSSYVIDTSFAFDFDSLLAGLGAL